MKRNIIFEGCHQQKFSQNFSFYNLFRYIDYAIFRKIDVRILLLCFRIPRFVLLRSVMPFCGQIDVRLVSPL